MSEKKVPIGMLATDEPDLYFEDNSVGRLKKEIWDASDAEIDAILAEYGVPSPVEWGKPGSYIQTTRKTGRRTISSLYPSAVQSCTGRTCPVPLIRYTSARSWKACGATRPSAEQRSTWP